MGQEMSKMSYTHVWWKEIIMITTSLIPAHKTWLDLAAFKFLITIITHSRYIKHKSDTDVKVRPILKKIGI